MNLVNSRVKTKPLQFGIDILIQLIIISGFAYAGYQVFFVFPNPGGGLPLFGEAKNISFEHLVARRLYAIEFWLIFIGYFIYLGLRKKIWNYQ